MLHGPSALPGAADSLPTFSSLAACSQRFGSLDEKTAVDVGCNDGSLLDLLRAAGAPTIGVEPTAVYREASEKGQAAFNAFLPQVTADAIASEFGKPDFITFTKRICPHRNAGGSLLITKAVG